MFSKLYRVIMLAWHYRKPIYACIKDMDVMSSLYNQLASTSDVQLAQSVVSSMLRLESVRETVLATPTKVDDEWLPKIQKFVEDFDLFRAAWNIMRGEWSIKITPDRKRRFLSRLREKMPFSSLGGQAADGVYEYEIPDEQTETGIIEIIHLISLLLTLLPKIKAILSYKV